MTGVLSRVRRSISTTALAVIIVVVVVVAVIGGYYAYISTKKPSVKYITIGVVYDSSGEFASSSMPEYEGLELWASWVNSHGGIYVKQYGRNLTVKVIALNAASNPSTAESDYETLVNTYHVDVLVADFGSVMTAPAVSFTNASHVLLWDVTGSSFKFFTNNNYIILTSLPVSPYFVLYVPGFLHMLGIHNVAVVYDDNDFNAYQAYFLAPGLSSYGIKVVYNTSVATSTSQYTSLVAAIESLHPQAVLELGYPTNDEAFLSQVEASHACFPLVLTNFPGQLLPIFVSSEPTAVNGTFTLAYPPIVEYTPQVASKLGLQWFGPTLPQFESMWVNFTHTSPNFLAIAGFNAGLIIQLAIQDAGTLNQAALKQAVLSDVSGKVMTIDGIFNVTSNGMQVGENPIPAQVFVWPNGTTTVNLLYPSEYANATAIYPEPCP
ncbi:ABC transporter substrate-binding protein [Acidilobus saccharovorans]|uniref:ABC transporter substrate-binding protein n=1 Tax=Acidilobus saccharovorans TaxID=242703 RepID=UPI001EE5830C|nr:ABC transporter substrate-binding protein [Acidilobus saccharovorans]